MLKWHFLKVPLIFYLIFWCPMLVPVRIRVHVQTYKMLQRLMKHTKQTYQFFVNAALLGYINEKIVPTMCKTHKIIKVRIPAKFRSLLRDQADKIGVRISDFLGYIIHGMLKIYVDSDTFTLYKDDHVKNIVRRICRQYSNQATPRSTKY